MAAVASLMSSSAVEAPLLRCNTNQKLIRFFLHRECLKDNVRCCFLYSCRVHWLAVGSISRDSECSSRRLWLVERVRGDTASISSLHRHPLVKHGRDVFGWINPSDQLVKADSNCSGASGPAGGTVFGRRSKSIYIMSLSKGTDTFVKWILLWKYWFNIFTHVKIRKYRSWNVLKNYKCG